MEKARPDIEAIYDTIKTGTGFSEYSRRAAVDRKEDALAYYDEHKDSFHILDKDILEVVDIYNFNNEQTGRAIKGGLLQKLLRKHNFGFYASNREKIYKIYKFILTTSY